MLFERPLCIQPVEIKYRLPSGRRYVKEFPKENWGKKILFNILPKPKEEWKAVLSIDLRKFTSFTTRFLFPMLTLTSLFPFLSTQD